MNRGRWLLLVASAVGVGLFLAFGPDEETVLRQSAAWRAEAHSNRFAALAVFFAAEVILIGLSVPVGMWLTVLAGFLFGPWVGTAVVSLGATAGAILAFLSARYVFFDVIHRA